MRHRTKSALESTRYAVSIDEKPVRRCAIGFTSAWASCRYVSIDEKPVRRCAICKLGSRPYHVSIDEKPVRRCAIAAIRARVVIVCVHR